MPGSDGSPDDTKEFPDIPDQPVRDPPLGEHSSDERPDKGAVAENAEKPDEPDAESKKDANEWKPGEGGPELWDADIPGSARDHYRQTTGSYFRDKTDERSGSVMSADPNAPQNYDYFGPTAYARAYAANYVSGAPCEYRTQGAFAVGGFVIGGGFGIAAGFWLGGGPVGAEVLGETFSQVGFDFALWLGGLSPVQAITCGPPDPEYPDPIDPKVLTPHGPIEPKDMGVGRDKINVETTHWKR